MFPPHFHGGESRSAGIYETSPQLFPLLFVPSSFLPKDLKASPGGCGQEWGLSHLAVTDESVTLHDSEQPPPSVSHWRMDVSGSLLTSPLTKLQSLDRASEYFYTCVLDPCLSKHQRYRTLALSCTTGTDPKTPNLSTLKRSARSLNPQLPRHTSHHREKIDLDTVHYRVKHQS